MLSAQELDGAVWTRTVLADGRPPATPRDQGQETVRRLVAGSLAALLVLVVVGYLVGARFAERQVLVEAKRFCGVVSSGVVKPHLTPALLAGDPEARAELDEVVQERLIAVTSVRRVKVWSADGRVIYSDNAKEIGKKYSVTDSQRTALRTGGTVAEVSELGRKESRLERGLGSRLLELYTGVKAVNGEPMLVESYMDYDDVRERRIAVFETLSLIGAAGVALFAVFQLCLGMVNLRWLRRRQAALEERARQASDRERRRVARDLHDGVVQDLVGTSYVVEGVLRSIRAGKPAEAERLLAGAGSSVRNSIQSLRSTMAEIYPSTIRQRGLASALDDLVQPLRTRGVDVEVRVEVADALTPELTEALYRAAQEAVRNVAHHSRARSAQVLVTDLGDVLRLVVRDDGVGTPPGEIGSPRADTSGRHFGLRALADVAVEHHGSLEVWSAPGRGTEIRMELHR